MPGIILTLENLFLQDIMTHKNWVGSHEKFMLFKSLKRSKHGNFAETIVVVTASFLQNVNGGNDNSFPHHFFLIIMVSKSFPVGNYMFKVNNRNTRRKLVICSKLTIKTTDFKQKRNNK